MSKLLLSLNFQHRCDGGVVQYAMHRQYLGNREIASQALICPAAWVTRSATVMVEPQGKMPWPFFTRLFAVPFVARLALLSCIQTGGYGLTMVSLHCERTT